MGLNTSSLPEENSVIYKSYDPTGEVAHLVEKVMYGHAPSGIDYELTIPPSGGLFLSYVLGESIDVKFSNKLYAERPKIFIGGQLKTETPRLLPTGEFKLIGFQLKPCAFFEIFGLNASRFTDDIVDFQKIDSVGHEFILRNLKGESSITTIISTISGYLLNNAGYHDCAYIPAVIKYMKERNGLVRVNELADKFNQPSRQLRRNFLKIIGLSPKYYAKIIQLNTALELIRNNDESKLTELALESGYYDQSHFIKDFHRYLDQNPMQFIKSGDLFLNTFFAKAKR